MKLRNLLTAALALLMLTACAENPDSDLIVHKDTEKLIGEAQQTGTGKAEVADLQQSERYTADFENESLRVRVHADAVVDIPQTEQLSVFRVRQHQFTDADIAPFKQAFFGDAALYDGFIMRQDTKADLEPQIAAARAALDEAAAGEPQNDQEAKNREIYLRESQAYLDRLEAQYEAAPAEPELVPADGRLQNAADNLASGRNHDYWKWQTELGCREAADLRTADNHAALYVQNNPDYSNCMIFSKSPVGTEFTGVLGGGHNLSSAKNDPGTDVPILTDGSDPETVFTPIPGDSAALSQAEAQKQAEDFLKAVGLNDFAFSEGGKYQVCLDLRLHNGTNYKQTCWVLHYFRCFDGVMLDQASGTKLVDEWQGDEYRKQLWPGEMIELMVNDTGIVGFCWNAPLEITETVVSHTALQPFENIRSTFEKMCPMTAASRNEFDRTEVQISRVTLSYSRISEKDSFDTGLVVPVWGFSGSCTNGFFGISYTGTVTAVNAIDGSVINPSLGY